MKKIKVLSALTACMLMAVSVAPVMSSATVIWDAYQSGSLEDILSSYDEETNYISRFDNGANIITEEGIVVSFKETETGRFIRVKKNTELSVDDIKQKYNVNIEKQDDTTYWVKSIVLTDGLESFFDDIVLNDNVVSIDLGKQVIRKDGDVRAFIIDTNLSEEEMKSRYPDLTESISETEYYHSINPENIGRVFKRSGSVSAYDIQKVLDSDQDLTVVNYLNEFNTSASLEPYSTSMNNIYTAPISGDVNADGAIDIADVLGVSAYVADPESNPIKVEQRRTNGDVHNSGDGLTTNDVLMIQQYLAKVIDTL